MARWRFSTACVCHHSIWYPINLLAAAGSAEHLGSMSYDQLLSLQRLALGAGASSFTAVGSAMMGLLYGIALPMFPRRPLLLGGILAPLFWSGIFLHGGWVS